MNKWLLILLSVLFSNLISAHAYYFAFAEMEYNSTNQNFEISIRCTGHDFEHYMQHRERIIPSLEEAKSNPLALKLIEQTILEEFTIQINEQNLRLTLLGLEVNTKDEVIFYLTSNPIPLPEEVHVKFDLLMNFFPEQQNKLTLIKQQEKSYYSFLPHKRNRLISLRS